jgi:S-DNA-T family DNA segregation ATPase FtsK/SpoIIIE
VFLYVGLFVLISLASYHPFDPSWNTVTQLVKPANLTGRLGAVVSDWLLQSLGLAAYAIPALILMLGWKWIRSSWIQAPWAKMLGSAMLIGATCAAFGFAPGWHPIANAVPAGGFVGLVLAETLVESMNLIGAAMFTAVCWILGLYLFTTFEMARLPRWFRVPAAWGRGVSARWNSWREGRALIAKERAEKRALRRAMAAREAEAQQRHQPMAAEPEPQTADDIPIRMLEYHAPEPIALEPEAPAPAESPRPRASKSYEPPRKQRTSYRLPPTELLQEPAGRSTFDTLELKETIQNRSLKWSSYAY